MPESTGEKWLAGVWEEVLEIDDICLNDTFFDVGGHSLLVMKVITSVHEKTGVKLGPQEFLMSTLEQMADQISKSFQFENMDEVETKSAKAVKAAEETIDIGDQTTVETKMSGAFRILKGFWK